ncbi:DUF3078 domain-containing protein [uncultured Eudoraea sp.]|uniref:DUF3078 domain-containing protein n=1 Tax=uncultured Eudoraea sp. TaxID=1035614 RepID=UPI0026180AB7|nr:DUF3078 domain-containing protein [uncultured Eudoraea sp.]
MTARLTLLGLLLLYSSYAYLQDTIPEPTVIDTTKIDTIVIRAAQYKVKAVPRGVRFINPDISFNETKVLTDVRKPFKIPSFWTKENKLGFNINQVAFVNWNAGGENSISGIANLKFVRNYKFRYLKWNNELILGYGLNIQEDREPRKTQDIIRLTSTFSYRRDTLSQWYYSVNTRFNTQFADGFNYPDRDNPISRFMAPGYLFFGGGPSFSPDGEDLNLYLSPTTLKATFVQDQTLANQGAFGVKRAIYDLDGNIITEGEKKFIEFGILVTNTWEKEIAKNITMNHRLNLFTDYIRRFGNIDIDWELNFTFKVNDLFEANLGTHVIYDDDIRFDQVISDTGNIIDPGVPKIQFRQVLAIGLAYNF